MKAYFRRSLNKADAIIGRTLSDSDTEQKSNPKVSV
jgi:hypothetical protein